MGVIVLTLGICVHYLLVLAVLYRSLTREDREPASRMAWMLVVLGLPVLGVLLYILFGELNIGRSAQGRMQTVLRMLPGEPRAKAGAWELHPLFEPLFDRAAAVNGFRPTCGNRFDLAADSDAAIDMLISDIDAAQDHAHLLFYIWLPDRNGLRVAEAVKQAAGRGVACRVMVDGMGSRKFLAHPAWAEMAAAGVETGVTFPIRWPLLRMFVSRVDLRNHRKIAVIDGGITYVGSQNCADAEFRVKPRFAPWVDIAFRVTGPVAWQQQQLFVTDWMTHTGKDISAMLDHAPEVSGGDVRAIAWGSGPNIDIYAVSDVFQLAAASARDRLVISTPYYVPTEALNQQIRSAALRGVRVTMLLPARNDSFFVAMASRSYYQSLLRAGVEILEYRSGLLHAKTVVMDDHAVIIGSANMDRRSFELNYENCVVAEDAELARAALVRQAVWRAESHAVTLEEVRSWSTMRRMAQNLAAVIGPLL